jgi:hypothetical protein
MSALEVVLLVLGLLALVACLLALIVIPVVLLLRRRSRRVAADLAAELATEPALRGPEKGLYRGGTTGYSKLKGNGMIALTQRRLLFRMLVGSDLDIPVEEITGLREAKVFEGAVVGGHVHLIVQTGTGEVGFFVTDNAAWIAAITSAAPALR